jgi:hypothetical protein
LIGSGRLVAVTGCHRIHAKRPVTAQAREVPRM